MAALAHLASAFEERGYARTSNNSRTVISAVEHETKLLPNECVHADGSLDLYEDVQKLFNPVFLKGKPALQCGGWVGYIPINDRYALEVNARVPVANLERLIGLSGGYAPQILHRYKRVFAHTPEKPSALFDLICDQYLDLLDRVRMTGWLHTYKERTRESASPTGRIDPFRSALRTYKRGAPVALSTSFFRTADCVANRALKHALERLLRRYLDMSTSAEHEVRLRRIRDSLEQLDGVSAAKLADLAPAAMAAVIRHLPGSHESYVDALAFAQIVNLDLGLAIRGEGGVAILPSILVDMSVVFESYLRELLSRNSAASDLVVKDGNKGGMAGARCPMFTELRQGLSNPAATPDIVIDDLTSTRLVIDAKYKPPKALPDRSDLNQVIAYGERYGCSKVMLAYPGRKGDEPHVELVGKVRNCSVFTARIDLAAQDMEAEEAVFVQQVQAVC